MGGCGMTQIFCGSSDQPLSANFIFLAYSRKDYAIMLLFFYSLSFFFPQLLLFSKGQFVKPLQKFWENALWLDRTLFKGKR